MTSHGEPTKFTGRNVAISEAALGAFAVLLGVFVAIGATQFGSGGTYDALGPSLLPFLIAGGLVLTGLSILIGAFVARAPAEPREQLDWAPVMLIILGMIVPIVFILTLGWIPVVTILFALGARAFGSRRTALDIGIGFAFGLMSFAVFNYGLGLNLPAGSFVTRLLGG
jgi:putative tricarboxylic transport membrane protein